MTSLSTRPLTDIRILWPQPDREFKSVTSDDVSKQISLTRRSLWFKSSASAKASGRAALLLLVTASAAALSACGTKYSNTTPAPTSAPAPSEATVPPPSTTTITAPTAVSPEIRPTSIPDESAPRSLPAAVALREQAASAAASDNHARAIGLLERAIRISPNDPATFAALAESHLAQSRPQQALELTRRALSLNPTIDQQLNLEALEQQCLALL